MKYEDDPRQITAEAIVQVVSEDGLFQVRLFTTGEAGVPTAVATWRTSREDLRAAYLDEASWIRLGDLHDFLALEGFETLTQQIYDSLRRQVLDIEDKETKP